MTPEPVAVAPDRTVAQFVEEAAGNRRFSSYPVVDGERLVGVVLLAAAAAVPPAQRERRRVAEIMTGREQVTTVGGSRAAADVLAQLAGQGKRAMVVEDGRLVGVVSGTDVIRERALAQARGLAGQERPRGPGLAVWVVLALVLLVAGAAVYRPPFVVVAPGGRPTSAAT